MSVTRATRPLSGCAIGCGCAAVILSMFQWHEATSITLILLATAGLAAICAWWDERGLTWTVGITGAATAVLYLIDPWLSFDLVLLVAIVGYLSTHKIEAKKMYPILFFNRWLHTKVNNLDTEMLGLTLTENGITRPVARLGHFGLDFLIVVWPWRFETWPSDLIDLDFAPFELKTGSGNGGEEAIVVADPAMSFLWSPNLRLAINRLPTNVRRRDERGKELEPIVVVDSNNKDGTLTNYLEPYVQNAIRDVVVEKYAFGGTKDVNVNVEEIRTDTLKMLAAEHSPFHLLGLLDGNGVPGPSARTFELVLQELLPKEGSDLAKSIGAQATATRRAAADAHIRRTTGKADAEMEALKTLEVGRATADAARALIDAETEGIREQLTALRRRGLAPEVTLDAFTTRRAAQAGGTMIMIPGLAHAVGAVTAAAAGKKEEGTKGS